jgi:hypothetical protein
MKFISFLILVGAVSALAAPIINGAIDKRTPVAGECNGDDQCNGVGNNGSSKSSDSSDSTDSTDSSKSTDSEEFDLFDAPSETPDPKTSSTDSSSDPVTPDVPETKTKVTPPTGDAPPHKNNGPTHHSVTPEFYEEGFGFEDSDGKRK